MTERLAIVGKIGTLAYCYSCHAPLATRALYGGPVRLVGGLVPLPGKKDGLTRYGLPRRQGHELRSSTPSSVMDIGNPAAFWANCPNCGRSQLVRWKT